MDKKTAIIVGVIILVLTSIVTPFVLRKITDKTNDISQGMQVGETNKQNESGEIQEDKVFSGERISNEEIQDPCKLLCYLVWSWILHQQFCH